MAKTRSPINLTGVDWTRPCVDLIDEVTDRLIVEAGLSWEAAIEKADRIVMERLQ